MTPLTVAVLACTILLAGDALGHMPAGEMVRAVHLEDGQTPIIDGEFDDWEGIAPVLQMADFGDLVAGAVADALDFDLQVWIGWNDTENRLYLAVEVTDDIHQVDRPTGSATTRIFQDDDLEVFVDADHSGGQYADFSDLSPDEQLARNGTEANHFVLAGPHEDGEDFVNFSAAGWYALRDGPYTQADLRFDGTPGGAGVTRYEMSLVLFDRVNVTADFLSSRHDLRPGEVIGFNLELNDFDSHSELFDAKWSLSGGFNAFRLSDRFTDLWLEPPVIATAVQDVSWGRIKASFRP
jgi:hypothetical protein